MLHTLSATRYICYTLYWIHTISASYHICNTLHLLHTISALQYRLYLLHTVSATHYICNTQYLLHRPCICQTLCISKQLNKYSKQYKNSCTFFITCMCIFSNKLYLIYIIYICYINILFICYKLYLLHRHKIFATQWRRLHSKQIKTMLFCLFSEKSFSNIPSKQTSMKNTFF